MARIQMYRDSGRVQYSDRESNCVRLNEHESATTVASQLSLKSKYHSSTLTNRRGLREIASRGRSLSVPPNCSFFSSPISGYKHLVYGTSCNRTPPAMQPPMMTFSPILVRRKPFRPYGSFGWESRRGTADTTDGSARFEGNAAAAALRGTTYPTFSRSEPPTRLEAASAGGCVPASKSPASSLLRGE